MRRISVEQAFSPAAGLAGRRPALQVVLLLLAASACAAPVVTKVDPPNWWVPHSINPVRLLIAGSGLSRARVESTDSGVAVASPARASANGKYVFVDINVRSAGSHPLRVITPEGAATVPFTVLDPLPREGRFQGFSPDDVIYLLMPDRFANGDPSNDDPDISKGLHDRAKARYYHGGDLQGVIDRLPYLKDLGVTAIWMTPLYDNANRLNYRELDGNKPIADYHGYGAVDFYGIDEHFGNLAKVRELVDRAHRAGLKIILDMVANHTGPYHPWVEQPPTPTWYHGTAAQHPKETWQTWTLMYPHSPQPLIRSTLDGWFADILPDLNQDDPEVARYIIQNTVWWVSVTGADGIREDTMSYVPRSFWPRWMAAIKREFPALRVVGEVFDVDPVLVSFFQGGRRQWDGIDTGVDSVFDFPQNAMLRRVFASGEPVRLQAEMLAHDYLYPDPDRLVTFLGLHDMGRFMNEKRATIEGLKLAFTYLLTSRGIPMIYYGDEIAMHGAGDPDNRHDFPGGWPGDARNAFEAAGRTPEEESTFEYLRQLTHIRAAHPALRRGRLAQLDVEDQAYAFSRTLDGDKLVVVFNNAPGPASLHFESPLTSARDLLGIATNAAVRDGMVYVDLPPRSAAILVEK